MAQPGAGIRGVGWWVIFSTMNLHMIGSSFARTMLLDRGISNWKRRVIVLTLTALAAGAVLVWAVRSLPPPDTQKFERLPDVLYYAQSIFQSGPLPYLLYPLRLVVRPYLAMDARAALLALGPALLLMAAHYWWVMRSNVAFEEASIEASRKTAERIATIRANRGMSAGKPTKKKRAPFKLRPVGTPMVGLLWKNLIGAGQMFTLRSWLLFGWITVVVGAVSGVFSTVAHNSVGTDTRVNALMVIAGAIAAMFLFMSLLVGPQLVRQDFRQADCSDGRRAQDVSDGKLANGAGRTAGTDRDFDGSAMAVDHPELRVVIRRQRAATAGNAAGHRERRGDPCAMLECDLAVDSERGGFVFPQLVSLSGKGRAAGIEATGQRLIFFLGQAVVFLISLVPAALTFGVVYFVSRMALGPYGAVPVGALAAALVMAGEAVLGVLLLEQDCSSGWICRRKQ